MYRLLKDAIVITCIMSTVAAAQNQGIIHGSVFENGHKPLVGVKVDMFARGDRMVDEHVTDKNGHFEFEQVPFGQYRLSFNAPDGRVDERNVQVVSGDVVTVDVLMESFGEEVVVVAPSPKAPPPPKTSSSTSTLSHEEIRSLPRGDTASVNEILSTQPGFVYDAFGNLFARGNHANIQYELDGVPLPDSVSGLFGGFLSPKLIENMEVITGGLGAEYGERLAAVVNLNSRRPTTQGEGEAELTYGSYNTGSPSAQYGRRFGRFSLLFGGSYRRTDRILDPQAFEPILHDYGDEERGFLRLDYDAGDHDHVSVLASYSRNFYQIPIDPTSTPCDTSQPNCGRVPDSFGNPAAPFFPFDTNATERERDFFSLASYRHDFSAASSLRVSGYVRASGALFFGDAAHALGPTADPCLAPNGFPCPLTDTVDPHEKTSDVNRYATHVGLDTAYLLRIGETHVLKFGLKIDQLFGLTQYTSYTRSDALQAPDPSLTIGGSDTARATSGGAYAQDRINLGKLVINAGLRADFQKVSFLGGTDQAPQIGIGPRLGASYSFSTNVVAHAFAGLLWMPPPVLDSSAAARILNAFNPNQPLQYDLLPEQDRYAEIGVTARVLPELSLTLNGWGRLSVDQLDDVEVGSTNLVTPYNFNQGRAAGVEAGANFVLSRWFTAFANGSLETAEGRGIATAKYLFSDAQLANNSWQLLDHVQTFTGNAGITFHDGPTQVSSLLAYGSGLRTGPANNEHVPGHPRVDLTLSHDFLNAPLHPTLAADVVNLFDTHYPYRISNGFNGSHWAPGRSIYLRLTSSF